jgi:plastocyanin
MLRMRKSIFIILAATVLLLISAVTASAQANLKLTIGGKGFTAPSPEIDRGGTVTFENRWRMQITLVCSEGDQNFSLDIGEAQTADHQFDRAGNYNCDFLTAGKRNSAGTIRVNCLPARDVGEVRIKFDFGNIPRQAQAMVGQEIQFQNASDEPLRIKSADGTIDTGVIAAGATSTFTPKKTGRFDLNVYRGDDPGAPQQLSIVCP